MEFNKLNSFLHLCYLPEVFTEFIQHIIDNPEDFKKQKEWMGKQDSKTLIKEGVLLFKRVFKELVEKSTDKKYIIPLSGGLDSRAILAHLIELGFKDNVVTVTYGIPGAYDYEIGIQVARFAQVQNIAFDLNKIAITRIDLCDTCKTKGAWTPLTPSYYNRLCVSKFGTGCYYWSGFFGDNIAGSHYRPGYDKLNWTDAKKKFWDYNKWEKNSLIRLTHPDFNFNNVLPSEPLLDDPHLISYPEQMDFCIRQSSWIKKAIVDIAPDVITPFTNQEWVSFMLAVPNEQRIGCELYRSILTKEFPDYYSLPTKNLNGKPLINSENSFELPASGLFRRLFLGNINKGLNYIDYDNAYRQRNDFIELAKNSLLNLNNMNIVPWLIMQSLWDNHKCGNLNLWKTIESLISLEISCNHDDIEANLIKYKLMQ